MSDFESAKVKVKQGWLQGYVDGKLKIFKGIPYAAPPVGALRFRHPQDPGRWRGVRAAKEYSAAAIQHVREFSELPANVHGVPQIMARSQYEEDCLYLNVWSPAKSPEDKLPVFVWIHGGGMVAGSGVEVVCDGDGFAKRKDVVVVTINYRLGFFGFFAHPDLTKEAGTSGNYALYDMRKACQWLKENIAVFGGDPNNITVAGQSGGAAGTGALLASPLMKGLIEHVSIESGPIYWGFMQPPMLADVEQRGVEFMKLVGCETIEELRQRDAWDLFDEYEKLGRGPMSFSFCIDGQFLPEPYQQAMDAGHFNDFDVLMGSCAQEFPIRRPGQITVEEFNKYLEETFPDNVENMKKWYPATNTAEAAKNLATISSDIMLCGSIRIGQLCHQYGKKAFIWLMVKENETERGHTFGCPHCAEMPYVFGRVDKGESNPFADYHWVGADYDFMEQIQGYWYNFCKNGDPNGDGLPVWKQYAADFDVNELGNFTHMITEDPEKIAKYTYYYNKIKDRPSGSRGGGLRDLPRL